MNHDRTAEMRTVQPTPRRVQLRLAWSAGEGRRTQDLTTAGGYQRWSWYVAGKRLFVHVHPGERPRFEVLR